jgi:hypothetical protein
MTKRTKSLPALLLLVCGMALATAAYAQAPALPPGSPPPATPDTALPPASPPAATAATEEKAAPVPIKLTPEELNATFNGSFFLTPSEITAIQLAQLGKPATPETLDNGAPAPVIPQHRVISVAGVLYRSANDWVVWMNGKKVTPKDLLPEIVDIKVESSSRVRLKWYDAGLKSVIAITLRPHQTYDIASGYLLPGSEH